MKVKYPEGITNAKDKTEVLYRMQELLRQEYNSYGERYRNKEITEKEWNAYKEEFEQKEKPIIEEILAQREIMKNNKNLNVTLKDNLVE